MPQGEGGGGRSGKSRLRSSGADLMTLGGEEGTPRQGGRGGGRGGEDLPRVHAAVQHDPSGFASSAKLQAKVFIIRLRIIMLLRICSSNSSTDNIPLIRTGTICSVLLYVHVIVLLYNAT
jgi:hypothetical protein